MERMTHEADFGLEDWEETLFFVKSDPNGAYNIIDIAKYQGEPEFDEILKNVALRLAAYENTGLEPEEIVKIREDIENGYMKSTARRYGVPVDRLRELAEADREGRCVVLDGKSRDKELIRKLVRLLYWLEDCVKKKDFSPFRIVAGALEINYPFISAFQRIENEYELEIHLAGKDEEAEAALEHKK